MPDFDGVDVDATPWPSQPLLGALCEAMIELQLPRATARHPSLVRAALTAVLEATMKFGDEASALAMEDSTAEDGADDSTSYWCDDDDEEDPAAAEDQLEASLLETAQQIAGELADEWSAPLSGVRALQGLGAFGSGSDLGALSEAGNTFSPRDGLWQHVGWGMLDSVQAQLRELTELTEMVHTLGQRAAADGTPQRGPAVVADPNAAPAAALSELSPRELSGLGLPPETPPNPCPFAAALTCPFAAAH